MTPAESRALMAREIAAQAETVPTLAPRLAAAASTIPLGAARRVFAGGCGDGLFAAQMCAELFRSRGVEYRAASSAEMLWSDPPSDRDAALFLSVSGGTRRTVEAAAAATARGAETVALTLSAESALGQACRRTVELGYEPISRATPHSLDHAVCLAALAALSGASAGDLAEASGFLASTPPVSTPGPKARVFFLGGGETGRGGAGYGAAKLHEAGGIAAWAYCCEDFAHGPLFQARDGDTAVLCAGDVASDQRTLALADGLERLGLDVARVGFEVPSPLGRVFAVSRALQQVCLMLAEARDLDVTNPAGGGAAAAVQRDWFAWSSR